MKERKFAHILFAIAIVVIGVYVYHMLSSHKGTSIIPSV
jgi:hypothetical protein